MSRNLCKTLCAFCEGTVKLEEAPRPITRAYAGAYFEEYEGMLVANASCVDCCAKYLAWVDERSRVRPGRYSRLCAGGDDDRTHFDLSHRSTFDDEPGKEDCPLYTIETVRRRVGPWVPPAHWIEQEVYGFEKPKPTPSPQGARNREAQVRIFDAICFTTLFDNELLGWTTYAYGDSVGERRAKLAKAELRRRVKIENDDDSGPEPSGAPRVGELWRHLASGQLVRVTRVFRTAAVEAEDLERDPDARLCAVSTPGGAVDGVGLIGPALRWARARE